MGMLYLYKILHHMNHDNLVISQAVVTGSIPDGVIGIFR